MAKQVIAFHYNLTDEQGKLIDSSEGMPPLTFLEGTGQIIPGLETAIMNLNTGDKREIRVEYKDAYGAYDKAQIYRVSRKHFPTGDLKVGDAFEMGEGGHYRIITVVEITGDDVTVDANHPLAGKNLVFNVEVMSRRDATADEITHGHVHGEGGHHH